MKAYCKAAMAVMSSTFNVSELIEYEQGMGGLKVRKVRKVVEKVWDFISPLQGLKKFGGIFTHGLPGCVAIMLSNIPKYDMISPIE